LESRFYAYMSNSCRPFRADLESMSPGALALQVAVFTDVDERTHTESPTHLDGMAGAGPPACSHCQARKQG
jgi:hypothetical protein